MMEPGAAPRKVWERKQDAAYDDPGKPVTRRDTGDAGGGGGGGRGGAGGGPIIQNGDYIYRRRRRARRPKAIGRSSTS